MPNLSGERKKLDLGNTRAAKAKTGPKAAVASGSKVKARPRPGDDDEELEEGYDGTGEEEDEDEVIAASIKGAKDNSNNTLKFVLCGVAVVLVILAAFLLFGRKLIDKDEPEANPNQQVEQQTQQGQTQQQQTPPSSQGQQSGDNTGTPGQDPNLGTQNFLDNTTMTSDSPLTDPNNYVKDIYGLTLRVDYEVDDIYYAADFVSYTKNRGTWGGGLELYWLDVQYKGNKYVVQVPFQYYKELDDIGIVPVKMEVLRIKDSTTTDKYLSIISYMSLDEETLKQVLKSQNKK